MIIHHWPEPAFDNKETKPFVLHANRFGRRRLICQNCPLSGRFNEAKKLLEKCTSSDWKHSSSKGQKISEKNLYLVICTFPFPKNEWNIYPSDYFLIIFIFRVFEEMRIKQFNSEISWPLLLLSGLQVSNCR